MEKEVPYDRERLLELYEELTLTEIAELFGVPLGRIYRDFLLWEIERRKRGRRIRFLGPTAEELERMQREEDLTEIEVAEKFGVSKATVQRWKKRKGVVSCRKPGRRRGS